MSAVILRKHLDAAVVKVDAERRHIKFIASQEVVDRDGEVLLADGIDTAEFLRNPVMLCNHDHDFAFGRVTALRVEQRPGGKALVGEADILPAGISARVDEAWAALVFGARNAFSIGFLPVESSRDAVLPGQRGCTYLKVKLMEISSVSVPSCPTCLIEAKRWTGGSKSVGGERVVLRLAPDDEGSEESGELIQLQAMKTMVTQLGTLQAGVAAHVDALIADASGPPPPSEELEQARLTALLALIKQMLGSLDAICGLASALLDDEADDDQPIVFAPDAVAAVRAAAARQRNPMADPFARGHHVGGERFTVDTDALSAALRMVVPSATREAVNEQVVIALARARGRVD